MRSTYRVLAGLVALGVVLQASFIAAGTFGIFHDADNGGVFDKNNLNLGQLAHSITGSMLIPLAALVLLIVSFFAKLPGGVKWAAIVFGLVVVQVLLAYMSYDVPEIGFLHGINALALFSVAVLASRRARGAAPVSEAAAAPATDAKV
jgi:heme A synthase